MLDQTSMDALYKACQNKLQVVVNYMKKTTGEFVTHTGGVQEINSGEGIIWLWDTQRNDSIRKFYIANIQGIEVLNIPYVGNGYPIKIDGQELGF